MIVGVITDLHGNEPATDAVLSEFHRLGADQVICLGDAVDPFPRSAQVLRKLVERKIPTLRGNHEDYVIWTREGTGDDKVRGPRFAPVQQAATSFKADEIREMKSWPVSMRMRDLPGVIFCHASPDSNTLGWKTDVSEELANRLDAVEAELLIGGHWHTPREQTWRGKTLVTVGAAGIPFGRAGHAEFLVLEAGPAGFRREHLSVPFDLENSVGNYLQSGWIGPGAPVSILYLLELATGERALSPFFTRLKGLAAEPTDRAGLTRELIRFLRDTGRWERLREISRETADTLEGRD